MQAMNQPTESHYIIQRGEWDRLARSAAGDAGREG